MRSLRTALTVAKRDVFSFFVSPLAYVVLGVWMVWMGASFTMLAYFSAEQPMGSGSSLDQLLKQLFGGTMLFYVPLLVVVPLLTMRAFADESRQGTIEPLLTAPVSDGAVVMGKYLATLVFWLAMFVPTLMYVWRASDFGEVDLGAMAATYLGVFILGVAWMALGVFASTLVSSPIAAAMLTFLIVGGHFMIGLGQYVASDSGLRSVFEYLSPWAHLSTFATGVVDTRAFVFYGSLAAVALFLSVRVLESRRYES